MIDHVSIAVTDLARSVAFYDAVLQPIGLTRVVTRVRSIGWGKRYPEFWINFRSELSSPPDNPGAHIALRGPDPDAVAAFHSAALLHGGRCNGPPAWRQGEMTRYFGAFVLDPDGNKIEAVTFERRGEAT